MRLKLINETAWSSSDLRRFLLAGMKAKGVEDRVVRVVYGKWDAHHGLAWLNSNRLQLSLPGPRAITRAIVHGREPINYLEFAQVLEHEIDHTLGLEHRDMLDWWKLRPVWQTGLTIEWTGAPPIIQPWMIETARPVVRSAASPPRRRRRRRATRHHFTPPGARPRFTAPGAQ